MAEKLHLHNRHGSRGKIEDYSSEDHQATVLPIERVLTKFVVLTEIDDTLWALIEPNLQPQKPITGKPRADLRKTFNGILYALIVGCR
jgi:hypothetical protein